MYVCNDRFVESGKTDTKHDKKCIFSKPDEFFDCLWFSRLISILITLPTAAVVNVLLSRKLDAMAYCGIGHNHATRKLLYTIVSHVNDAVQRTVLSPMELILLRSPEYCPWVVSLLVKSYNPHERYGAAMAFDIACACSG